MKKKQEKALGKFLEPELVETVISSGERAKQSNSKYQVTREFESLDELYKNQYSPDDGVGNKQTGAIPRPRTKLDLYFLSMLEQKSKSDTLLLEAIKSIQESVEEVASRPIEIKVEIPEIPAPIVNVEVPATVVKQGKIAAPVIKVETSKDMKNVLSAIKSLVDELKKSNKIGAPKVEVNVKGELSLPDHEVETEKVVQRDSFNRIQRTVATRKIIKK